MPCIHQALGLRAPHISYKQMLCNRFASCTASGDKQIRAFVHFSRLLSWASHLPGCPSRHRTCAQSSTCLASSSVMKAACCCFLRPFALLFLILLHGRAPAAPPGEQLPAGQCPFPAGREHHGPAPWRRRQQAPTRVPQPPARSLCSARRQLPANARLLWGCPSRHPLRCQSLLLLQLPPTLRRRPVLAPLLPRASAAGRRVGPRAAGPRDPRVEPPRGRLRKRRRRVVRADRRGAAARRPLLPAVLTPRQQLLADAPRGLVKLRDGGCGQGKIRAGRPGVVTETVAGERRIEEQGQGGLVRAPHLCRRSLPGSSARGPRAGVRGL